MIEPDYGLLEELSTDILDDEQIEEVRAAKTVSKQNSRLLNHLKNRSEDVCRKFLTALEKTKQDHVANLIWLDGSK